MKNGILIGALWTLAACAAPQAGGAANTADDAEAAAAGGALEAGTTVCISDLVGVRWALEDALREHDLTPEDSCMAADVQLKESGSPSSWVMQYQRVGDSEWKECRSEQDARAAFAEECIQQMISELGGG